ncbi:ABC transporter permease subunit [Prevotella sp. Rep29]|nr:ABC transporter permease subunit [Prevotella sp. Rep29]QYR10891.1 ABC transporter permease subunit [Prevotella sp. Rep29]
MKRKMQWMLAAILLLCGSSTLTGCASLVNGVTESFKNNLIVEDRYKMILDGLQVTLLITLCAMILGTLLGGLVCWMRMSRHAWLQRIAKVYIDLMRGTPVLVLLMLMFYVVMAPLNATGIVVAIVTFSMNMAAYVSEMLRTSIEGIDRGQTEAGLALGYTQRQTFFRIILPQVIKAVMPVYQGEVVSLLKGTSIVGYIAVADMTRASDLIRSRTFDAFFPLIVTAIIYFLMAWLIGLLLTALVQRQRAKAVVAAVLLLLSGAVGFLPGVLNGAEANAVAKTGDTSSAPPVFKALAGKRVGVVIGSVQDMAVTKFASDAEILRLTSVADVLAALESGKIDVATEENLSVIFNKELAAKVDTVNAGLPPSPIGACFRLGNTELQQDFNSFIADIRRDGTYEKIYDRWRNATDPSAMEIPQQQGTGRTLRVASYPAMPPFNFINSGKQSGLEIDILTEWANRRNWKLEYLTTDFAAQIPAVQTGKADMAMGAISITEERQKQVLFSDGYIESHIMFLVRKGEMGILTNQSQSLPVEKGNGKWWWIIPILVILGGGCAWFMLRRKRHPLHPETPSLVEGQETDAALISISHMKKSYGAIDVLRDINLDVHRGEVISVIGPSGTGKSTFLRCLNLLEQPTSGSILIDGQDILSPDADVPMLRRKMGMVFQSFNLFNGMSVLDNVCLAPVQLLGKSREEAEQKARQLLEMVGLSERINAMPDQLSGGQKQRVAIARALAMEPEILLFDEPTSALDPAMVSEVLGVMTRLAQQGMTMIVVTHEMRFARQVSSRVLFFAEGVVYEDGTPDQLFDNPQRELTRQFIHQIRETTFVIETEHFDWYAMIAQMEQFCQRYNLSSQQINSVLHVVDESLAILGTAPGMRLTLAYTEQDDTLQFTVNSPQAIDPAVLDRDGNKIATTILRNFSRDIRIDGNTFCVVVS